jgi:hypothetical protein
VHAHEHVGVCSAAWGSVGDKCWAGSLVPQRRRRCSPHGTEHVWAGNNNGIAGKTILIRNPSPRAAWAAKRLLPQCHQGGAGTWSCSTL